MTRLKREKRVVGRGDATDRDVRFGTPELVAQYRAQRIAAVKPDTIIELGAGAGFQTKEFARVAKHVIAVDIDGDRLARAKELPGNVTCIAGDALDPNVIEQVRSLVHGSAVLFLDPERPPASAQRTVEEINPDPRRVFAVYGPMCDALAVELPPFLHEMPFPCEREYLSVDGQLNRLTVYTGTLRSCETSVVALPSGARIENEVLPGGLASEVAPRDARFLLVPDAALAHAGLITCALEVPASAVQIGKKSVLLTAKSPRSPFFISYKLLLTGERDILQQLPRLDCGAVILHGTLTPDEQRALLARLRPLCKGHRRLHLFLGAAWRLAVPHSRMETKQ
jgi:SAM-dependent methyltransferase